MVTKIYLSESSLLLNMLVSKEPHIKEYPEEKQHPCKFLQRAMSLIGYSFCTHHEAFVNIFGHLIGEGLLKKEDVEVHILERDKRVEGMEIEDKVYRYDDEGFLVDFPLGFFSYYH